MHDGQTLTLNQGGSLPANFTAGHGSNVIIHGGNVGGNFEAVSATVTIDGGVLNTIDAFAATTVDISGNAFWSGLNLYKGATANIHSGTYNGGNFFTLSSPVR